MSDRIPIVEAADLPDCPCCNEKWCPVCEAHYVDCACIGPGNADDEGYDVTEDEQGRKWATKRSGPNAHP